MKNGDLPAMPITAEPYPVGAIPTNRQVASGLTKREQFAMAAMQGLLAKYGTHSDFASDSVLCADALLAELERRK